MNEYSLDLTEAWLSKTSTISINVNRFYPLDRLTGCKHGPAKVNQLFSWLIRTINPEIFRLFYQPIYQYTTLELTVLSHQYTQQKTLCLAQCKGLSEKIGEHPKIDFILSIDWPVTSMIHAKSPIR